MGSLTQEAAAGWRRAAVPRWVTRVVLTSLWLAAFVVAVATDEMLCTPLDPSVCGTDPVDAVLIAAAVATPVLLVWLPVLGCGWGAAFPLLLVAADEPGVVQFAFGLHGFASAVVAVWWWRSRGEQRRLTAASAGGATRPVPPVPDVPGSGLVDPRTAWQPIRLTAAALALLAGLGMFSWHVHAGRVEARHTARAVEVVAEVIATDDVAEVTLRVPDPFGGTRRVDLGVWEADQYPVGSRVRALVDPADEGWVRLVAEPRDTTGWLSGAIGAVLLAGLWAGQELRRRWALQTLWLGQHPALDVLVVPNDVGDALVFPRDADPHTFAPVARVPVAGLLPDASHIAELMLATDVDGSEYQAEELAAFARAWRGDDDLDEPVVPEPGTLVGDLRDGGWALLLVEEGVLVPAGHLRVRTSTLPSGSRLRRLRRRFPVGPWRNEDPDAARGTAVSGDGLLPGVPVLAPAVYELPDLPHMVRTAGRIRLIGAAMVVAAFVATPAGVLLFAENWYQRGIAVLIGGEMLAAGTGRLVTRLRLDDDHLEITTAWRRHVVSWAELHGVRRDGRRLILAWHPDIVLELPELTASGAGPTVGAEALGRLLAALHDRSALRGRPVEVGSGGRGPIWLVVPAYGVVMTFVLWIVAAGWIAAPLL